MGFLRLLLAICVAQQHLYIYSYTGSIAVYGFFVLSGFLIAMIGNEVYGGGIGGKGAFLLNRFLRIYPVYWACLYFGIYALRVAPMEGYHLLSDMALPGGEWWRQYWIFGLVRLDGSIYMPRVLEPAWSLNIELFYYLLIGLFIGRSRQLCWCWFGVSLFYVVRLCLQGDFFDKVYFGYMGNGLQFSVGCLCYHYRERIPRWRFGQAPLLLLSLFLAAAPVKIAFIAGHWVAWHYVAMVLFAYAIVSLYRIGQERKARLKQGASAWHGALDYADRACARLSYPFFLLHCSVGALVSRYVVHHMGRGMDVYAWGVFCSLGLSAVVVLAVELPVEYVRKAVRPFPSPGAGRAIASR